MELIKIIVWALLYFEMQVTPKLHPQTSLSKDSQAHRATAQGTSDWQGPNPNAGFCWSLPYSGYISPAHCRIHFIHCLNATWLEMNPLSFPAIFSNPHSEPATFYAWAATPFVVPTSWGQSTAASCLIAPPRHHLGPPCHFSMPSWPKASAMFNYVRKNPRRCLQAHLHSFL